MKVICIFELRGANGKLFATQFEGEAKNESEFSQNAFSKLRSEWNDPEWLRSFFVTFKKDYYRFYGPKSVGKLVRETLSLADHLFEVLMTATLSQELGHLFKPLNNSEFGNEYDFQKLKAKGEERKSYLRIYAVRYGDEFVISGGAIKLTNSMDNRPHTKLEKHKLEAVVDFLKQKNMEGKIVYLDS